MIRGVYIHIPFCRHKCNYCDFNSHISTECERERYVKALIEEIRAEKRAWVDTVYFGGGTPTVLKEEQLISILDAVKESFCLTDDCEITTELNPATIDYDGLLKLKNAGFNRLSIGMQSADNQELLLLGRIHTFEETKKCVFDAKRAGFENISVDLMFGIINQDLQSFKKTLDEAILLDVKHISCYALKVEEGTPLSKMEINIADDEESFQMYDYAVAALEKNGFKRYEISNFAKSGFQSRHNKKYWLCHDFYGFGAGAYSCINGVRYSNYSDTEEYIKSKDKVKERTPLSKEDMMSEFVFLGLRLCEGISTADFYDRFSVDIYEVFGDAINKNIARKTLQKEGDRIKIPDKYMYVSNLIMVDFV